MSLQRWCYPFQWNKKVADFGAPSVRKVPRLFLHTIKTNGCISKSTFLRVLICDQFPHGWFDKGMEIWYNILGVFYHLRCFMEWRRFSARLLQWNDRNAFLLKTVVAQTQRFCIKTSVAASLLLWTKAKQQRIWWYLLFTFLRTNGKVEWTEPWKKSRTTRCFPSRNRSR